MLTITFQSRGPSQRQHVASFDFGTAAKNVAYALKYAHTHNSEIIESKDDSESLSYGVRCGDCGEWETVCRCED